jgi:hypothetical protein
MIFMVVTPVWFTFYLYGRHVSSGSVNREPAKAPLFLNPRPASRLPGQMGKNALFSACIFPLRLESMTNQKSDGTCQSTSEPQILITPIIPTFVGGRQHRPPITAPSFMPC